MRAAVIISTGVMGSATSPATVCSACHDSSQAMAHFKANGGMFYATRAEVLAKGGNNEQCMVCHGPGRIAAIGSAHLH